MTAIDYALKTQELIDYYKNLLIIQYHNKPKAKATVSAFVKELLADLVAMQVRDTFDINIAEGEQLDIIAKYAGVDRVYDNTGLADGDLRWLIRMKILQNNSDHTLYQISRYIADNIADVHIVDNKDMTIAYLYPLFFDTIMQISLNYGLLPKPLGVSIILSPTLTDNGAFGFSFGGIASALVNGYGYNRTGDEYEGGTYFAQSHNN